MYLCICSQILKLDTGNISDSTDQVVINRENRTKKIPAHMSDGNRY